MNKYIKITLIGLYTLLFFYIIFPFIYVNSFYFWIANNSNEIEKNKVDSKYMLIWNQKMIVEVIKFKIKTPIFNFQNYYDKERDENDYDTFMTLNDFTLDEIFNLTKERKESNYYLLGKFLHENDISYLEESDIKIINSLKIILNKEIYKKEIKEKYREKFKIILTRVNNINSKNEYFKIYKEYLKKNIKDFYDKK